VAAATEDRRAEAIAIVDERPAEQYLSGIYTSSTIVSKKGIEAIIADGRDFTSRMDCCSRRAAGRSHLQQAG
jgi:hypothetical protein